jgi:ADP-glucose pyrophosphorylase
MAAGHREAAMDPLDRLTDSARWRIPRFASAENRAPVVSSLVRSTYAVVLAGGRGSRLKQLTDWRCKPAVPFGGKHRIIDFALSNCINSGVRRIGVATQYRSHSLIRHLQRGWNFLDPRLQEFMDVLAGNGPCNQQRMEKRRKAHDDGAWVREAARAYAEKHAARNAA